MPNHIGRLDGLRSILAWWVVVAHALQWAGIKYQDMPESLNFLFLGIIPVYGFMFLSGFVITHLIENKNEPYLPFLARRYFRLAPLLVVCMVIGFFIELVLPRTNFFPEDLIFQRILSHLTLMHGIFPDEIFPKEASSFINPGWSISLEWQFYLLAPIFVSAFKGNRVTLAITAAILAFSIYIGYQHDARKFSLLGETYTFAKPSIIFSVLPYFLTGIIARLIWGRLGGSIQGSALLFVVIMICSLFFDVRDDTFMRWQVAPIMAASLYIVFASKDLIAKVLESAPLIFLGKISYSTYLLHYFIIALSATLLRPVVGSGWELFWWVMLVSVPGTLIASVIGYYLVEMPGNQAGRKLAKLLTRKPATEQK